MPDPPAGLAVALADRYTIERELGRGGNAVVYLAYDPKHDRKVALKVLLPELALSVRAERFLREIQIAAKLTHPHILPLYDSGAAEGILYYVMPYVAGESLRDRLQRDAHRGEGQAGRSRRPLHDRAGARSRGCDTVISLAHGAVCLRATGVITL
jgi:serine/threonine-protein kinase